MKYNLNTVNILLFKAKWNQNILMVLKFYYNLKVMLMY